MAEHFEPEVGSLQRKPGSLYEWLSPVTAFEFEIDFPTDDCAERLLDLEQPWLHRFLTGATVLPRIEGGGYGNYSFLVIYTSGRTGDLKATGRLLRSDGLTLVRGDVHARNRSIPILFPTMFYGGLLLVAILGLFAGTTQGILCGVLLSALLLPFATMTQIAARKSLLRAESYFIETFKEAPTPDKYTGKKKKKRTM